MSNTPEPIDSETNSISSLSLIDDCASDVLTAVSICSAPDRAESPPLSCSDATASCGHENGKLDSVLEKLEQLLSINADLKQQTESLSKRVESLEKPGRISGFHYQLQNAAQVHQYERDYMRDHASAYKYIILVTLRIHYRGGGHQDAVCQMKQYEHDSVKKLGLASVKHALGTTKNASSSQFTCKPAYADVTIEQLENDEDLRGVRFLSQQMIADTCEAGDHFSKELFQNIPLWHPVFRSTCYRFDVAMD